MRIVTWNVNGLRSVIQGTGWRQMLALKPDFILVQETRIGGFAAPALDLPAEFTVNWNRPKRAGIWGVATLSRPAPLSVSQTVIEHVRFNAEGRSILSTFADYALLNLYVPHGRRDGQDLDYKLAVLEELAAFVEKWKGPPLIIAGDFNIAHDDLDLARPGPNKKHTMYTAAERGALSKLLGSGQLDSVRHFLPTTPGVYSWWPYAFSARERNVGWRIDYVLIPTEMQDRILTASHAPWVLGSDHCPVVVDLIEKQSNRIGAGRYGI